jgi:hypothetical protein
MRFQTLVTARLGQVLRVSVLVLCLMVAPFSAAQALPLPQVAPDGAPSLLAYPYPNGGSAVVDGNPGEWNLAADFFVDMYRAGNPNFTVLSKLYLRYNCTTNTLYLLVLAEPGRKIESFHTQAENWAKIGAQTRVSNLSGNDGVPPDFSYINSDGTLADGWEASFLINPGNYIEFNVHAQVNDGGAGGQTSTVANRSIQLSLDCTRLGSIGDYVWHDADGEGDQDEPPANGLAGIRVRLLNGAATQVLDVQTTDSGGYYLFADLPAGNYIVDVNEQDVIDLYGLPALTTNNEPYPYSLLAGEHHRDADFGYWAPAGRVALGDYVWHDFNSNGQQDFPAESPQNAGVRCISIWLYDGNGAYLDRTNTDSWGIYMFYDLAPGVYTTVIHAADPDLEQINGILSCSLDDGTPPATLSSALRAPAAVYFTTATSRTDDVSPAGTINLTYDYGISTTPLGVLLAGFSANQEWEHVVVRWETVSEVGNAGFNLYRSDSAAGPLTLLAYLPSQAPGSTQGFVYNYEDLDVQPGETWWYTLEDISLSGATTLHGPVSATVQAPTAVTLGALQAGPAAGAAPLLAALLALAAPLAGAAWTLRRRP